MLTIRLDLVAHNLSKNIWKNINPKIRSLLEMDLQLDNNKIIFNTDFNKIHKKATLLGLAPFTVKPVKSYTIVHHENMAGFIRKGEAPVNTDLDLNHLNGFDVTVHDLSMHYPAYALMTSKFKSFLDKLIIPDTNLIRLVKRFDLITVIMTLILSETFERKDIPEALTLLTNVGNFNNIEIRQIISHLNEWKNEVNDLIKKI